MLNIYGHAQTVCRDALRCDVFVEVDPRKGSDILGRCGMELVVMEDVLAERQTACGTKLYIATLSRQTIEDCGAEHLGFEGFFVFEECDAIGINGITVLAKAISFESALRLSEIFSV
ncbi:MAG: hypothetical protein U1E42_00320 [Rhodospirillales bacterium]